MVVWTRVRYRVSQFFRTWWASRRTLDLTYPARHLSPELMRLFQQMPRAEQHHAVEVCRALEAQGQREPALLAAALLHDAGKIRMPLSLWERVFVVLAEHYAPRRAARWREGNHKLSRPLVVRQRHPEWGAELARNAGAPARTVEFILRHHAPPEDDAELAALQRVDESL